MTGEGAGETEGRHHPVTSMSDRSEGDSVTGEERTEAATRTLSKADAANKATRENCPNSAAHVADEPNGYLQWHAWAKAKSKTHRQRKCPGCDLWLIWEPR